MEILFVKNPCLEFINSNKIGIDLVKAHYTVSIVINLQPGNNNDF